jgi:hypothetical protein
MVIFPRSSNVLMWRESGVNILDPDAVKKNSLNDEVIIGRRKVTQYRPAESCCVYTSDLTILQNLRMGSDMVECRSHLLCVCLIRLPRRSVCERSQIDYLNLSLNCRSEHSASSLSQNSHFQIRKAGWYRGVSVSVPESLQ